MRGSDSGSRDHGMDVLGVKEAFGWGGTTEASKWDWVDVSTASRLQLVNQKAVTLRVCVGRTIGR